MVTYFSVFLTSLIFLFTPQLTIFTLGKQFANVQLLTMAVSRNLMELKTQLQLDTRFECVCKDQLTKFSKNNYLASPFPSKSCRFFFPIRQYMICEIFKMDP